MVQLKIAIASGKGGTGKTLLATNIARTFSDMGEKVSEFLRPSTGISTIMPLGNTPFMATVGPSRYQDENDNDWDYYTISVQKKEGKSSYVFFERQFKIEDIPKELVNKTANEIASYDKKTGIVKFALGHKEYEYNLPKKR